MHGLFANLFWEKNIILINFKSDKTGLMRFYFDDASAKQLLRQIFYKNVYYQFSEIRIKTDNVNVDFYC